MFYISNAFSLNMLNTATMGAVASAIVAKVSDEEAVKYATDPGVVSVVGHADTAAVLSADLGIEIPCNRATVSLDKGDSVLVGQYRGPRLPEGAKELPAGATIEWLLVSIR